MKKLIILLLFPLCCQAQTDVLNIPELMQLVSYSKSEHSRQVDARDKQLLVTGIETSNKGLIGKTKNMYRTLQNRYSTLGTAISAAQIGLQAYSMVSSIVSSQRQLYDQAKKNPAILTLAYAAEFDFVERSELLMDYIAGLVLSYGDINQMKSSDRKLLFDFILTELSNIQHLSNQLLRSVQYGTLAVLLKSVNPFRSFVYQDEHIVKDIISNAKYLKR
jgi:hypothetical protein